MFNFNGIDREIINFKLSSGISDFEDRFDATIYCQGSNITRNIPTKLQIFAYSKVEDPQNAVILTKTINLSSEKRLDINEDDHLFYNTFLCEYRLDDSIFAAIDVWGNLHTGDFYHLGRNFIDVFREVVESWLKFIGTRFDYFTEVSLSDVEKVFANFYKNVEVRKTSSIKIREIAVSFDHIAYEKHVRSDLINAVDEAKSVISKDYQIKIDSLYDTLNTVRDEHKLALINRFVEGFKAADVKGWKIVGDRFRRTRVIKPVKIKCDGRIHIFDDRRFDVKKLEVTFNGNVYSGSRHPNINPESGLVCLGDLDGKSVAELLAGLPKLLETINLDSSFDGSMTDDAQKIFHELDNNQPKAQVFVTKEI